MNETSADPAHEDGQEPLKFEIGEVVDLNQLPGVPEIFEEVMGRPVPQERVQFLRDNFYPGFSDEEIILIESTLTFHFEKFGKIARWAYKRDNPKPRVEEYGVAEDAALNERLGVIDELSRDHETSTAFASLEMVEKYLTLPGLGSLKEKIIEKLAEKERLRFTDVGCGGQAADIQLLCDDDLIGQNIEAVGISAFDYGENLRPAFPELEGKIGFEKTNVYTGEFETKSDVVFSVRTLPDTGVVDAVRFLKSLHDMATDDGLIWMEGVIENSFDFSDTEFKNLEEFLESIQEEFPSLRFRKKTGDYVIYWEKADGFPFDGFFAQEAVYDQGTKLAYLVRYKIDSDTPQQQLL